MQQRGCVHRHSLAAAAVSRTAAERFRTARTFAIAAALVKVVFPCSCVLPKMVPFTVGIKPMYYLPILFKNEKPRREAPRRGSESTFDTCISVARGHQPFLASLEIKKMLQLPRRFAPRLLSIDLSG